MKYTVMKVLAAILFASLTALSVMGCYVDDTIDSGEGYGLRIGDSKQETFIKARAALKDETTYILSPIDKQGFGPHTKIAFSNEDFNHIKSQDTWEFYFDSGYKNSLKLQFSEGRLSQIHRHRQAIELP